MKGLAVKQMNRNWIAKNSSTGVFYLFWACYFKRLVWFLKTERNDTKILELTLTKTAVVNL